MFDVFLLKALRVLDRTWFPIKTTVLNIDTWTLGISIYIYDDNIYLSIYIYYAYVWKCLQGLQGGFYINDLNLRLVLQTDMPVVDDTDSSRAFSQERMSKLKAEAHGTGLLIMASQPTPP